MRHQESLLEMRLWRVLLRWKPLAENAVLTSAVVQNIVILLRFGVDGETPQSMAEGGLHLTNTLLGSVQVLFSLAIAVLCMPPSYLRCRCSAVA